MNFAAAGGGILFAGQAPLRRKAGAFQAAATPHAGKRPVPGVARAGRLNRLSGALPRQAA